MYEAYNYLFKKIDNKIDSENLKENTEDLTVMSPIIPHFASMS